MTQRPREARSRRFERFRNGGPAAGEEFPLLEGVLLEGGSWRSSDYRGRVLVVETGSFT